MSATFDCADPDSRAEGLKAAERVVASGVAFLTDGQKVTTK